MIEHSLLPHIDCVIDHHKHMFVMRNIAHLFRNGHLDDVSALLLNVKHYCRKPPINVPYKRTFGMPDQSQMLDV